jgi:hypothetical protein
LPLYTIGPLVRGRRLCSLTDIDSDEVRCIKFLDSKRPNSVLYISFGSHNTIPSLQMIELAKGLEASGRPLSGLLGLQLNLELEEENLEKSDSQRDLKQISLRKHKVFWCTSEPHKW